MLAYSGEYRTEGNKIIINVDIAWDEAWTGSEQVRYYRIDGVYRVGTAALLPPGTVAALPGLTTL